MSRSPTDFRFDPDITVIIGASPLSKSGARGPIALMVPGRAVCNKMRESGTRSLSHRQLIIKQDPDSESCQGFLFYKVLRLAADIRIKQEFCG